MNGDFMRNTASKAATASVTPSPLTQFAKFSVIGLVLGALLVSTATAWAEESQSYDFKDFTKINISEAIEGTVVQSDQFGITATAKDQDMLDSVIVELNGDTLKIHRKDMGLLKGLSKWFGSKSPQVQISMPDLTAAHVSAGAGLEIGSFATQSLELHVSAGADLVAEQLEVNQISGDSSSGADLELGGTCTTGAFSVSSGADIRAKSLKCETVEVSASSGGDADVFASEKVKANASSGADIDVNGSPSQTETTSSSGGEINID